jgi:tRNA(Ile)-lysidine synthase
MADDELRENAPEDGRPGSPVPPAAEKLSSFDPFAAGVEVGLGAAFTCAGLISDDQPLSYSFIIPLPIMVALSGGPDSTALLAACIALRDKLGMELTACHVNHHTRAVESDRDEAFCRELCKTWNIPLAVRHIYPEQQERPAEAVLRELRYENLVGAAGQLGARFIALAHTLNDQIETILFRLFRGTGLAGMAGMEAARRLSPSVLVVRPLLSTPRRDCLDYLRRIGIEARQDTSNLDLGYARNYIRHRVIPAIEERFPGFQERIDQLRQRVSTEEAFLNEMTDEAFNQLSSLPNFGPNTWDLATFKGFPAAIQRRLVARALKRRGIEVTFQRVTCILETIESAAPWGARMSLSWQWDVSADGNTVRWIDKEAQEPAGITAEMEYPLKMPGLTTIAALGRALKIEAWSGPAGRPVFPPAEAWEALVDLSHVNLPLVVRGRRPGDHIRPFGMDTLVRLKKYLHTRKRAAPGAEQRSHIFLVADQEEVIWVPGVGLSNKVRVTGSPSHKLSWVVLAPDEIYFS